MSENIFKNMYTSIFTTKTDENNKENDSKYKNSNSQNRENTPFSAQREDAYSKSIKTYCGLQNKKPDILG